MARKKRSKGLQINFPPNIQRLAEEFHSQRLNDEQVERQKKLTQEKERKRVRARRLQSGLPYAKQIFCWAKAFRSSEIGQELMGKSHIPTAYKSILFYDGHVEGVEWFGLGISDKGLFLDRGGRWSVAIRETIKSAFDLAVAVDTEVLKAACEWIENGKVWECIERRFDYLKERK